MKKYANLVKRHSRSLKTAGLHKTASDVALLLDHPIFGYPTGEKVDSYALSHRAKIREEMYDILCSAFASISLPLPPLEPEFYESVLKDEVEEKNATEAKRIRGHLTSQIGKSKNTVSVSLCNSISTVMETFPSCLGWGSLDKRTLVAKLNQLLIADGCEPVRPDYSVWKNNGASAMDAPAKNVRILIIDDDTTDLAKTVKALVGWKNVTLVLMKYNRRNRSDAKVEPSEMMRTTAQTIVSEKPDVVLMDQGLDTDMEGSQLIPVIRELAPNIRYVANTGGQDTEQRNVGAFPNCNKGEKLQPIAQAIKDLK